MRHDVTDVTVWWWHAPLDTTGLHWLLDEAERARRDRYRTALDAARFVAGAAVVRCAAGLVVGVAPDRVVVDRTCEVCGAPHGRPRPSGGGEVSVTHGGDVVAVARSSGPAVGVDVEPVAPLDEGVLAVALAPAERAGVVDGAGFARVWTRKEAVLKALGTGLRTGPATLEVSAPDAPPALLGLDGAAPPDCVLRDLDAGPGHAAALAVLGTSGPVVAHRSAEELVAPHRRAGADG